MSDGMTKPLLWTTGIAIGAAGLILGAQWFHKNYLASPQTPQPIALEQQVTQAELDTLKGRVQTLEEQLGQYHVAIDAPGQRTAVQPTTPTPYQPDQETLDGMVIELLTGGENPAMNTVLDLMSIQHETGFHPERAMELYNKGVTATDMERLQPSIEGIKHMAEHLPLSDAAQLDFVVASDAYQKAFMKEHKLTADQLVMLALDDPSKHFLYAQGRFDTTEQWLGGTVEKRFLTAEQHSGTVGYMLKNRDDRIQGQMIKDRERATRLRVARRNK